MNHRIHRTLILVIGLLAIASTSYAEPSVVLQDGNHFPVRKLAVKRSAELADNHIGGDYGSDHAGNQDSIYRMGLKWLRIGFWDSSLNWQVVERPDGTYAVPAERDEYVNQLAANGVKVVLALSVGAGTKRLDATRFKDADEIDRYVRYAAFMAEHFKGRVYAYEIWNEANPHTASGDIPVENYVRLIRHATPAIRRADATVKIAIGAVGGSWQFNYPGYGKYGRYQLDRKYFEGVLRSGVGPLVDLISWHPFYGTRPDDPYYRDYPTMIRQLKKLAREQGFRGEYLAEEMLWRTDKADEPQQPVSPLVSAKYLARAIVVHRGLDITASASGMWPGRCGEMIRPLSTVLAGATADSIPVEIQCAAPYITHYGFRLPNGDRLFAMWSDRVAGDTPAGVCADVKLPVVGPCKAIGVDILSGSEQQLITETVGQMLVVPRLLMKDYPVFVRIEAATR